MRKLIRRLGRAIKGVITGFDRIVFKGSILPLCYSEGVMGFCGARGILNKDYRRWMMEQTGLLLESLDRYAREHCGEGIIHLSSWRSDKGELARKRQKELGIESGLIGVWSCLESGNTYRARYDAKAGYPQLRHYRTQCKHVYLYFDHEKYGLMNARLQTWFPYHIQICLNGRQWLRRRLEGQGIGFIHEDNKFFHIDDYSRAQRFLNEQLHRRWPRLLDGFLPLVFPSMRQTLGSKLSYYWTTWQSEWATDMIFESPEQLNAVIDPLLRHAMISGTGERILRYLDRPVTMAGRPDRRSHNQVVSRLLDYHDGLRVRHWVDSNSVKLYNQQNNLRGETTINDPGMFRFYRRAQGESSDAPKQLRTMRKGVADLPLRARVSQDINNRFLDAVATFSDQTPVREILSGPTRASTRNGRRIRALDPTGKDRQLLLAIGDPAFEVAGFTNAALRQRLASTSWGKGRTGKQLSARVSRQLRLLRDHGLIRKVPNRRRYHLTQKGRQLCTVLPALLAASTKKLMDLAA